MILRKLQPLIRHGISQNRCIYTSPSSQLFWVPHKKQGYEDDPPTIPSKKMIIEGLKDLKSEIKLWKEEMKEKFDDDPILQYRPNEIDVAYRFKEQKDCDQWITTCDSDHKQGHSTATFEISSAGHGLFSGDLSAEVPKDGKIKRAGYAAIRSMRYRRSFRRDAYLDWTAYNTLVLRVRGDGRPYMINIGCEGFFDVTWNDVYHYILYTRGGPHWQLMKIPFSKFFLTSNGVVQDKQQSIPLNKITTLGFSASGRGGFEGPFSLEIDYVGLEFDPSWTEEHAYEMYRCSKYIVAQ